MAESLEKPSGTSAQLQLSKEHMGLVSEMEAKVGSRVRIVLYGHLRALSQEAGDPTEEGGQTGALVMDVSNLKVASNNDIAELFDEEFDG